MGSESVCYCCSGLRVVPVARLFCGECCVMCVARHDEYLRLFIPAALGEPVNLGRSGRSIRPPPPRCVWPRIWRFGLLHPLAGGLVIAAASDCRGGPRITRENSAPCSVGGRSAF